MKFKSDIKTEALKKRIKKLADNLSSDRITMQTIGDLITRKAKSAISKGLSPVKGRGKFPQYAQVRDGDPKKYPHGERNKKVNPVNLKLSGEMLNHLGSWLERSGHRYVVWFGFNKKTTPSDIMKRVEAHNDGTLKDKNVPQRKMVPNKKGEEFIVTITRGIKDIILKKIRKNKR